MTGNAFFASRELEKVRKYGRVRGLGARLSHEGPLVAGAEPPSPVAFPGAIHQVRALDAYFAP